jgi:hypothetical protein
MAADTIKLPGAGKVPRKTVLVAGAVGVGIVGYAWWTRKPEVPEEVVTEEELDAIGDERIPTTGVPYDPNIGAPTTGITTNAEWSQFATDRLNSLGYDPIAVGDALGKFLGHQALTSVEANIARAALAQAGQPPQGGPWNVLTQAPVASVGLLAATGLAYTGAPTSITWRWNSVAGATSYEVELISGLSTVIKRATISSTSWTTTGLATDKPYRIVVAARNAAGIRGPTASLTGRTTASAGAAKPGPIVGLRAAATTRTAIDWRWNAVPGASYYKVVLTAGTTSKSTITRTPRYVWSGLRPGHPYRISVRAERTGAGTSAYATNVARTRP